ncbi:hypothetical protein [Bacillus sp. EAC]|uniref:hypothetical protein n=1 Tax=Bacillus sp. EAC TaxID=1978338 RepID=UPI000B44748B|nr:hypothetical protein [Bacillus sp. EAC]
MNKWKMLSLILLVILAVDVLFRLVDQFDEKREVSSYIQLVNGWKKTQIELEARYENEVVNQNEQKLALRTLIAILEENDELIWKTEQFKAKSAEVNLALKEYQEAFIYKSEVYRFLYYAKETGETNMNNAAEESLHQANKHFREHEKLLHQLAK